MIIPFRAPAILIAACLAALSPSARGSLDQYIQPADDLLNNRYTLSPHPTVTLPANPAWTENPLHDDNWVTQFQTLRFVYTLTRAWSLTQDQRYLDRAEFLLHSWYLANPPASPASPDAWADVAAQRAEVYVDTAPLLPNDAWIDDAIREQGEYLADPRHYAGKANHDLMKSIGLLKAGVYLKRSDWVDLAVERTNALIPVCIDKLGVINEQSMSYEYLDYRLYHKAEQLIIDAGLMPASQFQRLDLMPLFLAHATLPNGTYAPLGDTSGGQVYSIEGTPAEFAATQGASGPKPLFNYKVYSSGYAFVRTGWGEKRPYADETMMTLRFGPPCAFHGHADGSSLTLYGYGTQLLLDSGKYTYNPGDYRDYFTSRRAHNTIVTDDAVFDLQAGTHKDWTRVSPTLFEVATSATPYKGVTARRRTSFSRQMGYVVVDDQVQGDAARTYRQLWHLKEDADPVVQGKRVWTRRARGNVMIVQVLGPQAIEMVTGATSPIQGWVSYEYNVKLPAPVVAARVAGKSARLLTLLVPYEKSQQPNVHVSGVSRTASGYTMTVSVDGRSERLVMDAAASSITPLN